MGKRKIKKTENEACNSSATKYVLYICETKQKRMKEISSFLIGATSSGCGKTTLTIGLLNALKKRGINTQPFKCGPDYIDTKYHHIASGKNSINLDLFLSSEKHVQHLYQKYAAQSEVCITEGVMGLFDGYSKDEGSSAKVAEALKLPVVLVVNAKSTAYSVAALLYGFKHFSDKIEVVGVIFNFVGSESHYSFLKEACHKVGITSFGYLPKEIKLEAPSRHLGLTLDADFEFDTFANQAANLVEKYIDIDKLLLATRTKIAPAVDEQINKEGKLKIGVAYDEAFNFIYQENIACLESFGRVTYFSPLRDKVLPDSDLLYFPGGYPELYLEELRSNEPLMKQIRNYAEQDGKIWAECGGMMYLSSCIVTKEGKRYNLVDIFKQEATMEQMKLKLGYRTFEYQGMLLKGHEFHYSHIESNLPSVAQQKNARGGNVDTKLLRFKNVIGSYTHIYWAENKELLNLF